MGTGRGDGFLIAGFLSVPAELEGGHIPPTPAGQKGACVSAKMTQC